MDQALTPEQQAELADIEAQLSEAASDLETVRKTPKSFSEVKAEKLLALEQAREEKQAIMQARVDDAAYSEAVQKYGLSKVAIVEGRQGAIVMRAPLQGDHRAFQKRFASLAGREEDQEKVAVEFFKTLAVHPAKPALEALLAAYPNKLADMGAKVNSLLEGTVQERQKKA